MAVLSHILLYGAGAPDSSQRIVFGAVILSAIVCFSVAPVYRNWRIRGLLADLWLLLLAWSSTFALFSIYVVIVGVADAVPSSWLVGWYAFGLAAMTLLRVLLRGCSFTACVRAGWIVSASCWSGCVRQR